MYAETIKLVELNKLSDNVIIKKLDFQKKQRE
jgi:hypothetical protein